VIFEQALHIFFGLRIYHKIDVETVSGAESREHFQPNKKQPTKQTIRNSRPWSRAICDNRLLFHVHQATGAISKWSGRKYEGKYFPERLALTRLQ